MSSTGARPAGMWIIALVLLGNGALGAWLLLEQQIGQPTFLSFPMLTGGSRIEALIAYLCAELMCGCFLIAGIALLFSRKGAIPIYVAGLIFYAGYITAAFLIFFARGAWQSIVAGDFSVGDALFVSVFLVGGCALSFVVARAVYNYLRSLSRSGLLR
jgi:hypothetical protein